MALFSSRDLLPPLLAHLLRRLLAHRQLKREVEGEDTVSWTEDLIGRWGGPGEGGGPPEGLQRKGAAHAGRAGSVQSHFANWGQVEDACGQLRRTTSNVGRGRSWNQCYALGQQMFGVGAWRECQRPLRVTAALMMHMPFHQGAHATCSRALTFTRTRSFTGVRTKAAGFCRRGVSGVRGSEVELGAGEYSGDQRGHRKPAVPRKGVDGDAQLERRREGELQALELAESLDDKSEETQQCLKSIMTLRAKMKEAADGGGGGGGGK